MPLRRPRTIAAALVAGLLAASWPAVGCATRTLRVDTGRPVYPLALDEIASDRVLDVHVFRSGPRLRLTNTTPETLGPGRLWINARFSGEVGAVEPGETVEIGLLAFADRYDEPFRAGGFFGVTAPDPVVLLQLQQPRGPGSADAGPGVLGEDEELVALVVVQNEIR